MRTADVGGLQQSIGAVPLLRQHANQYLFANRRGYAHIANRVFFNNRARRPVSDRRLLDRNEPITDLRHGFKDEGQGRDATGNRPSARAIS